MTPFYVSFTPKIKIKPNTARRVSIENINIFVEINKNNWKSSVFICGKIDALLQIMKNNSNSVVRVVSSKIKNQNRMRS